MLWLTGALLTTSGGTVMGQSNDSDSRASLVGAWAVQVTLRDCATNAPLGPSFNSLVSFHRSGTLSESASAFDGGELLARPGIELVAIGPATALKAEQQIESCEHCHHDFCVL